MPRRAVALDALACTPTGGRLVVGHPLGGREVLG